LGFGTGKIIISVVFGTNCHLTTISKIVNDKLFSLLIKRLLGSFHEIFGPRVFVKFGCKRLAQGRKQLLVTPTYMIKLELRNVLKLLRL